MADSKQQDQAAADHTPEAERDGELADNDLDQVSGGSGVTTSAEISPKGSAPPTGQGTRDIFIQ
jgi:hypothetical protein